MGLSYHFDIVWVQTKCSNKTPKYSLFSYFSISKKYKILILTRYSDVMKILKYDSITIILGCTIQLLAIKNKIDNSKDIGEILKKLCVKKNTIMVKLRIYQKLLLNNI